MKREPLIPQHGGYKSLKSFQLAQLVYDITVRFRDLYIDRRSRTHDQMVQAARSGVQNIAEGSQASGTSKKTELKLTNVARASLEELRLDYEDFLRQRGMTVLPKDDARLMRFKGRRCANLEQVREWVEDERRRGGEHGLHGPSRTGTDAHGLSQTNMDRHGLTQTQPTTGNSRNAADAAPVHEGPCASVPVRESPCASVPVRVSPCLSLPSAALVANGVLSLLNLCCHLLDRQLAAQAAAFEREGGFTERLYRTRTSRRSRN